MGEAKQLFERLMFLCAPWEVVSVSCQEGGEDRSPGRVTIDLAVKKGQLVPCAQCGALCKRHDEKRREWRDRDLLGWRTVLHAAVPRANYPKHGIRQIEVPWAGKSPS